ncbi:MAG: hypothetical protein WA421_05320 [Nitrososphaeraceae archaeon]
MAAAERRLSSTSTSNKTIASSLSDREVSFELDRKITLATEGFATNKFCQLVLRDRNRLSKENPLILSNYIIVMKREVNPRLSYIRYTIEFLSELSRCAGIEKRFEDMMFAIEDVLLYLDSCRKSENLF